MNCVDAALEFANDPRNNGNGYSVKVELETGRVIEGVVASMGEQKDGVLVMLDDQAETRTNEVFIDKNRIVSITIIW